MRTGFAASLAFAAAVGVSAAPSLSLTIVVPSQVNHVDNLVVTTVVENTGSDTVKLLNDPRVPLSDTQTNSFNFANTKGSPHFTGIVVTYSHDYIVKNNDPTDFTVLAPGQTHKVMHSLAGVYNFTMAGHGEYKVDAFNVFPYVNDAGEVDFLEAATHSASFGISGRLASARGLRKREPRVLRKREDRPSVVGCTEAQIAEIAAAIAVAEPMVVDAIAYMETVNQDTDRYNTWFGDYDEARVATVSNHFRSMVGDSFRTTYDCSPCPEEYKNGQAYVNPTEPGYVYLCNAFWHAPPAGEGSRPGTLIQQQSHFEENGGTVDHAWGAYRCKELAQNDPEKAIQNADSHAYFAENAAALT